MGTDTLGVLVSLVTAALFAGANVYHRRATRHVRGIDATVFTLSVNVLVFAPVGLVYWSARGLPELNVLVVGHYVGVALFALIFGRLGMYNTIMLVGPSRASAIKNSAPLFTLAIAFLVLAAIPPPTALVGVAAIILGVWVQSAEREAPVVAAGSPAGALVGIPGLSALPPRTVGVALGLVVAAAYAAADVLRVLALRELPDVLTGAVAVSLLAWVMMAMPIVIRGGLRATIAASAGPGRRDLWWAGLLMALGQFANFAAVRLLFVGYVTALIATAPMFTALISRLLNRQDERLGWGFWLATALLVPGAALIKVAA